MAAAGMKCHRTQSATGVGQWLPQCHRVRRVEQIPELDGSVVARRCKNRAIGPKTYRPRRAVVCRERRGPALLTSMLVAC